MTTASPTDLGARLLAADLERQVAHWLAAAKTFRDAEEFASLEAWRAVEADVGAPIRRRLHEAVEDLIATGESSMRLVAAARQDPVGLREAATAVQRFRRRYMAIDTTLDFFGDAVNSRTSPSLRAALRTLDRLAVASMRPPLERVGKPVPSALVYADKGSGASILKVDTAMWAAGLRNPVAAIKIVRHNLYRPTSLFHETGHQVAHLTDWTRSIRDALAKAAGPDTALRTMWTPWASEVAADTYAFLHTGYASVAALYDVVGDAESILRWPLGDPHPIGWLRTLLGCAFAAECFGESGPWQSLAAAMLHRHPVSSADPTVAPLLARSQQRMRTIARACLDAPVPAMRGLPMTTVLSPDRVTPRALAELERTAGPALWTSGHWRQQEGIRMVALAGLREAEEPSTAPQWIERARTWMTTDAKAA
jgi:hypothetical protein